MSGKKVAAGIVLFYPDAIQVIRLAGVLAPEVGRLFVFCNSRLDPALRSFLNEHERVALIEAEQNLGIGAALNLIVLAAALSGFTDVVLFDQDSQPSSDTIAHLLVIQESLQIRGERPAVVAPRMTASADQISASKPPTYRTRKTHKKRRGAYPVHFVPTSGSLISLDAFRDIGEFRTDYFIDGIDLEWSFRAWACGWSCWMAAECTMVHQIGSGVIACPKLWFSMPNQRPFRMYCTIRNTVYGLRLRHIPASWKAKQIAYLPVQVVAYAVHHRLKPSVIMQMVAGLRDGLAGRLGIPRDVPDGRHADGLKGQSTR